MTAVLLPLAGGCTWQDDDHHHDRADAGPDASLVEPCPGEVGVICTLAGNGDRDLAGNGGPAREASLGLPTDLVVGPDGTMFVVDFNNYMIRAIDPETGIISRFAGTGELALECDAAAIGDDARDLCLNHPTAASFDGNGQMLVAAWFNSQVLVIDPATHRVSAAYGSGMRGYDGDGGPAVAATFDTPSSVIAGGDGGIYVTDQQNQVIRFIDGEGVIRRHAGQCVIEYDSQTGEPALCEPDEEPVACPDSDKTTCGDPEKDCIIPCQPAYGGDGGPALEMRMAQSFGGSNEPNGHLALDGDGNLYVSDSRNRRVRMIDPTGTVQTVVGTGEEGVAGDGGPATAAQLLDPTDLALAGDGALFIADPWANCVRRVAPDGIIDTVAGVCGAERSFTGDGGPATEAGLSMPYGLGVAGSVLYIADTGNNRIRAVRLE